MYMIEAFVKKEKKCQLLFLHSMEKSTILYPKCQVMFDFNKYMSAKYFFIKSNCLYTYFGCVEETILLDKCKEMCQKRGLLK